MKDDCREAKAPQERFQSALRCLVQEPEQRSQSALRGLLDATPDQPEVKATVSALTSLLGGTN